jgi:hypothetical protein
MKKLKEIIINIIGGAAAMLIIGVLPCIFFITYGYDSDHPNAWHDFELSKVPVSSWVFCGIWIVVLIILSCYSIKDKKGGLL